MAKKTSALSESLKTPPDPSKLIRKPFNIVAIAANAQYFPSEGSGKLAFPEGKLVNLEFGPTQITVHDPLYPSASPCNKLGVILFSYSYASYDKEFSMEKAADTGQVSKDVWFLFVKINHTKIQSGCCVCGKIFTRLKKQTESDHLRITDNHLAEHYSAKKI